MKQSRSPVFCNNDYFRHHHSNHFIVRDHNGQGLAYIYYESELRPALSRKPLTKDEARRIAANIAKLRLSVCVLLTGNGQPHSGVDLSPGISSKNE